MSESIDPSEAPENSPRKPPPEVEKRWRAKLGDEEYERMVRQIQGATPLFAQNDTAATPDESPKPDTATQSPPPKNPSAGREPDGNGADRSPPRAKRSTAIAVWVVAIALVALTVVLLAGAVADLVGDHSLTIAERAAGTVAVLSTLLGVIAIVVSVAPVVQGAIGDAGAVRSAALVLGTGLLLLGVAGGVSIASSIEDPCDAQCAVRKTVPTPSDAPISPTPET
ncbi:MULTISPECIES: hypothetical protein [Microbacterium]|uniref:hypothetical protein n=1 Tax=Microbacterium TaxID=33882 RepID=UPI0013A5B634|nr:MULTISPECIES: hypothetical protein [Microbacterium]